MQRRRTRAEGLRNCRCQGRMIYSRRETEDTFKIRTEQRAFWRRDRRVKADTGNGKLVRVVDKNVLRKTVRQEMNSSGKGAVPPSECARDVAWHSLLSS